VQIDKHQFFTGEDTDFFDSREAFEKARESLGDRNILVYDPDFIGKNGKKGFLFMNQKGRTLYEDILSTFESSIERGTFDNARGIVDILQGDLKTEAAKTAIESVEGLKEKVDAYKQTIPLLERDKSELSLFESAQLASSGGPLIEELIVGQLGIKPDSELYSALAASIGSQEIGQIGGTIS